MSRSKADKTANKPLVQIDRGIPLPARTRASKYPLADLGVGDSILVATRTTCAMRAKRLGIKVTVRQTPEGFRLWRIK